MTIKEEITLYAQDCISGKIISGQKHKWACQRMLKDFARADGEKPPFTWDEEAAKNIVDWFAMLRHSKGVLAGKPIMLTDWQKFMICQIYGWKRPDGLRRFKKSFCEVGRKNARIWRPMRKRMGV